MKIVFFHLFLSSVSHVLAQNTSPTLQPQSNIDCVQPSIYREIETKVKNYIDILHSLAQPKGFDLQTFVWMAPELSYQIDSIETAFQNTFSISSELGNQVELARNLFQRLETTARCLKEYGGKSTEEHFVRSVIELNARLISFYDSRGFPKLEIDLYDDEVTVNTRYLKFWKEVFADLQDVRTDVRLMFEVQAVEAEERMRELRYFISQRKAKLI